MEDKASEQERKLAEIPAEVQSDKVWTRQQKWYVENILSLLEEHRAEIEELKWENGYRMMVNEKFNETDEKHNREWKEVLEWERKERKKEGQ